uniref:U-scoloptoxin(16)-Ssd1a n=1 Tax=Scolopendra dehaani TaxID=2609776 RepID=TXG1A_SCODE|nr:RecName: Full=U-scoloptoxin(16)-Ssd1a; Short=U-SLPTX(16)-Ssd1a; AltName: Full=Toxin SSD377; Flags: Precursor [Scolopendra dehaani]
MTTSATVIIMVLCVGSLVIFSEGSIGFELVTPLPGKPDECPVEDGRTLAIGQTEQVPGQCEERTCIKMDDQLYFELAGCGISEAGPGCEMFESKAETYPECCTPEIKCN